MSLDRLDIFLLEVVSKNMLHRMQISFASGLIGEAGVDQDRAGSIFVLRHKLLHFRTFKIDQEYVDIFLSHLQTSLSASGPGRCYKRLPDHPE